jgi:hypothetical protein
MKAKPAKYKKAQPGMALLVVLFIVMGITLFSMGYIARCDSELLCAKNMGLRIRMEYLAQSALQHGRAMIIGPPNVVPIGYSQQLGLQLETGDDYYDLTISDPVVLNPSDPNISQYIYQVQCSAYRQASGQVSARSELNAQIKFTPFDGAALLESIGRN